MKAILAPVGHDPRKEIYDEIGHLIEEYEVLGDDILVCPYVRPEKTQSGLILTTKTQEEDIYQGKAALVLKMGPLAFEGDKERNIRVPEVGDWVVVRVGETFPLKLGERACRVCKWQAVRGIVRRPDIVL